MSNIETIFGSHQIIQTVNLSSDRTIKTVSGLIMQHLAHIQTPPSELLFRGFNGEMVNQVLTYGFESPDQRCIWATEIADLFTEERPSYGHLVDHILRHPIPALVMYYKKYFQEDANVSRRYHLVSDVSPITTLAKIFIFNKYPTQHNLPDIQQNFRPNPLHAQIPA